MEVLDPLSINHSLKALTNENLKLKNTIDQTQLENLEAKIMGDLPNYMKMDISAPINCMI